MNLVGYKLDGTTPQPCSIDEALQSMNDPARHVARTRFAGCFVSTVFLIFGDLDDDVTNARLFETIVLDQDQQIVSTERAATYEESVGQHQLAVMRIKEMTRQARLAWEFGYAQSQALR